MFDIWTPTLRIDDSIKQLILADYKHGAFLDVKLFNQL